VAPSLNVYIDPFKTVFRLIIHLIYMILMTDYLLIIAQFYYYSAKGGGP
jgi:hypothetical protein